MCTFENSYQRRRAFLCMYFCAYFPVSLNVGVYIIVDIGACMATGWYFCERA